MLLWKGRVVLFLWIPFPPPFKKNSTSPNLSERPNRPEQADAFLFYDDNLRQGHKHWRQSVEKHKVYSDISPAVIRRVEIFCLFSRLSIKSVTDTPSVLFRMKRRNLIRPSVLSLVCSYGSTEQNLEIISRAGYRFHLPHFPSWPLRITLRRRIKCPPESQYTRHVYDLCPPEGNIRTLGRNVSRPVPLFCHFSLHLLGLRP